LLTSVRYAQLPAAGLLALACALPSGGWAAASAMPWVIMCGAIAMTGCWQATQLDAPRPLDRLSGDSALIFLGVGGAWVFADRAGFQPLGFSPAIVALTGVHFHFAGLLLPLFAGFTVEAFRDARWSSIVAVVIVLGVPAVALGITTTQLGWGPTIEAIAGCGLAAAGFALGLFQLRLAADRAFGGVTRLLLWIAGVSLGFGMILAGLYAVRAFTLPFPWLELTWMRALHGTANALGFGLCGTLAWRRIKRASH
jgi:hypothetical protein